MCPNINAPENGIILSTKKMFHYGDVVSFLCDFAHVMVGSPTILCTSNGVWNGSVPSCECKLFLLLITNFLLSNY